MFLCHIDDLPDPGARGLDGPDGGPDILLVRLGQAVFAYHDCCPHQGAHLSWREHGPGKAARARIICYAHGAQFDPATGECLRGPCRGRFLQPVDIEVTVDGNVIVSSAPAQAGADPGVESRQ